MSQKYLLALFCKNIGELKTIMEGLRKLLTISSQLVLLAEREDFRLKEPSKLYIFRKTFFKSYIHFYEIIL